MGRTSLPPGFRFHPTDVELILYYLKRKIMGKKPHFFEAISELNICRFSPWDLPDKSCLKSNDLEWYFFSPREKKYASGARMNRATETGYWKTTGRDRPVIYDERTVGMVKSLVFHEGHAPKGKRTDWLIHEYRIEDLHMEEPTLQDSYVLCKVFKKNGPGPKNGAQYGAPFKEEDWEDDFETSDEPIPSAVFPAKHAYPINQIRSAVTGMIDPGCSSAQPTAEPVPSLSSLDTDEVPPNNQNCSVFMGVVDSGATLGQSLARPGPSLAMPHPSEVPSDDDISRFFASFPDDTYLLPIENIENVNNCNRGLNGDMMPCMDGNYSAFGGHDNFADVSGGRSNFPGMVTDHPPNSLFPQDDASFLELDDLIIPVEHCARASETQPLVEGNMYPSNDSFLGTGYFNYGGNFSGYNQFIPTQSQLQVLPEQYSQQVRYNQFIPTQSQLQVLPEQYSQQVTATEFNTNQGYNTWYDYGYDTPMHQNEFTDEKR